MQVRVTAFSPHRLDPVPPRQASFPGCFFKQHRQYSHTCTPIGCRGKDPQRANNMMKLFGLGQSATAESVPQEASVADHSSSLPSSEQLQKLIRSRRSIMPKDFTGEAVSRAKLEQMLEAANWAPNHKLTEPWRFVVLGGDAKKEFEELTIRLCGQKLEGDKAEQVMAKLRRKADTTWPKVHCYIALCMKRNASKLPEWEELSAVACAVQNMWLTATALDVSGYWSSWQEAARDDPEMLQFLRLDAAAGDRCLGVFVAGISNAAESYRGSRKPVEQKVEWRL